MRSQQKSYENRRKVDERKAYHPVAISTYHKSNLNIEFYQKAFLDDQQLSLGVLVRNLIDSLIYQSGLGEEYFPITHPWREGREQYITERFRAHNLPYFPELGLDRVMHLHEMYNHPPPPPPEIIEEIEDEPDEIKIEKEQDEDQDREQEKEQEEFALYPPGAEWSVPLDEADKPIEIEDPEIQTDLARLKRLKQLKLIQEKEEYEYEKQEEQEEQEGS